MKEITTDGLTADGIARALAPHIFELVSRARREGYRMPLELIITEADDALAYHFAVGADGVVHDRHQPFPRHAHFPLTATLTDQDGAEWESVYSLAEGSRVQ